MLIHFIQLFVGNDPSLHEGDHVQECKPIQFLHFIKTCFNEKFVVFYMTVTSVGDNLIV